MLSEGDPRGGTPILIFASVGTFHAGFDDLVASLDVAASRLRLRGLAQIGHSRVIPRHLNHVRFLDQEAMQAAIASADIIVCHGGMGIVGEALRAGKRIVAVPRTGPTSAGNPANDQRAFLERVATRFAIQVAETPAEIERGLSHLLDQPPSVMSAPVLAVSNVPRLIGSFLASSAEPIMRI
ncbi:MAG: glycosyltransferase [Geminicoccaceae bacterium]